MPFLCPLFLWNILHIYIISAIILLSISEIKTAQEIQKRNTDWGTFLSPTFLSATISNPKQFGWKQWNSLKTHTSESGLINLIRRLFKFQERKNEDILSVFFFLGKQLLLHTNTSWSGDWQAVLPGISAVGELRLS